MNLIKTTKPTIADGKAHKIQKLLEHPSLWQASHTNADHTASSGEENITRVKTGFQSVDSLLCHGGWPLGHLIECLSQNPGHGELDLFFPAIKQLAKPHEPMSITASAKKSAKSSAHQTIVKSSTKKKTSPVNCQNNQPIILISPPYIPYLESWEQQLKQPLQLWFITPKTLAQRLWAAEQVLLSNSASVVMLWLYQQKVRPVQLRKLQLAAKHSNSLIVMLRDLSVQHQASPAPLRLTISPGRKEERRTTLTIHIIKQQGNWGGEKALIPWHSQLQHPPLPIEQWPTYNSVDKNRLSLFSDPSTQDSHPPASTAKWS